MAGQRTEQPAASTLPVALSAIPENHVRLFKGATRVATVKGGVPARAFVIMIITVCSVAMFWLWFLLLIPVIYPIMAIISREDDRAFWILELWVRTNLFARNKRFWNAISFSPTPYQRRRAWCRYKEDPPQ
ncbi:type IV secretion system protein VirB3 [Pollutimonas bauzanensis]|uniref:Type IV secretion system protein VirB3 n=1 Tax=Pollutimonas bauzanensis TaxID=658167 RepID=A0A1M5YHV7_9BURK|nr:VirB3 family type IV secretion system protein [Pollutimonas bauzanensis]SHI11606.1 type IV secretion system protein VirB3 [Pollutimonas bauzanensis]